MKSMLRNCVVALALVAAAPAALAWTTSDRWGHAVLNGYDVWNNGWGRCYNYQYMNASSGTKWYIDTRQPNGCGVQSYPNSSKNINKRISAYNGTGSWNYSIPSGTTYWNASFDIWVPTEVMIWLGKSSGINPRGSQQYSNVSIGGHSWNVWRENSQYNVISYVRTSNSYSGSVNLRTMLDYARNTRRWIGDNTIRGNGLGFEIFGTGNVTKRFTYNSLYIGS